MVPKIRDEFGWCVPRRGTIARTIYEMFRSGIPDREIATFVGMHLELR